MDVHRIEGIKFDFDRLSDGELRNIQGHLLDRHARLVGEIALVEGAIFARSQDQLPLDNVFPIRGEVELPPEPAA